jgi:hypothetical protein
VDDAGELVETVTPSTNAGPNACLPPYAYGASRSRVLARGLRSTASVFSYFGKPTTGSLTGAAAPMTGNPPSVPTTTPDLTPDVVDSVSDIELVQIDLSVGTSSNPAVAPTHATIAVSLPNHLVASVNLPDSAC